MPEWLKASISPDEERAREDFLLRAHRARTSTLRGFHLGDPSSYLFVLNDLRTRPDEFSILMLEDDGIHRTWQILTKVNVLLDHGEIPDVDKLEVGTAFLRVLGEEELGAAVGRDVGVLALEVQSRVASVEEAREVRAILGESFSASQACRIAADLRGLVSKQAHINLLARILVLPEFEHLNPQRRDAVSEAFRHAVGEKRRVLAEILSPEQLVALYDDKGYDSLAYWQERLRRG